jgi:DNA ligase-1
MKRKVRRMHLKRFGPKDVLVNCFRSVLALRPTGEVVQATYLAVGRIAPNYEGAELNVGGSTVSKAIVAASGVSESRLSQLYQQLGDVGDVAQACKRTQAMLHRPAPLTVPGVFTALRQLAAEKGQGAAGRRQRAVLSLLTACRESETRYLTRTLVQALRVGANWRSVIPALAKAVVLHKEGGQVPKLRLDAAAAAATAAFHVCPNLALLIEAMLAHPAEEWEERCPLQPGVPIKPMLAKICSGGLADAARQLKGAPFLAEFKYDGQVD